VGQFDVGLPADLRPIGTDAKQQRGLDAIRARRLWVALWFVAFGPVAILFARTIARSERDFLLFFVGWCGVWIALIARMVSSRCPRCGNRFHFGRWSRAPNNPLFAYQRPWTRRCLRCGLELQR
jgi:hypothetical protein